MVQATPLACTAANVPRASSSRSTTAASPSVGGQWPSWTTSGGRGGPECVARRGTRQRGRAATTAHASKIVRCLLPERRASSLSGPRSAKSHGVSPACVPDAWPGTTIHRGTHGMKRAGRRPHQRLPPPRGGVTVSLMAPRLWKSGKRLRAASSTGSIGVVGTLTTGGGGS